MPPFDHLDRLRLRFVPAGEEAPPDLLGKEEIWLDVGGDVREGVIDHRHWPGYRGSSARLVLRHPWLLTAAVGPGGPEAVTFVLRNLPSLDAVTSAFLAAEYLRTGTFGSQAEALVEYVDLLATGYPGVTRDNLFTPYAAHHTIVRRYDDREGELSERSTAAVREGFRMLAESVRQVEAGGVSFGRVDAFGTPNLFGKKDRAWVREDLDRYKRRFREPLCRARVEELALPGRFTPHRRVPGLLIRHVQDSRDPEAVIFFKDWARSDSENAPSGAKGFEFLSVYGTWSEGQAYTMLSLPPESGACLKGLSALLSDREEKATRGRGKAKRGRAKPADKGSVWTDGYGFTLVRSPSSGTRLSAMMWRGPSGSSENKVHRRRHRFRPIRTGARWNCSSVIRVVVRSGRWRMCTPRLCGGGARRVFLDRENLPTGGAWLPRLARGVNACRHFVAVICPEYFQSEFCVTEMTWALMGDIQGTNRKVIPIVIEPVRPLPAFCQHIQFHSPPPAGVSDYLRTLLCLFSAR